MTASLLARVAAAGAAAVAFGFLFADPAAADNCDIFINPQDCQNTGWTVGSIAAAAGAAAAAAAAASKGKPKVIDKPRKFANCQEATAALNNGARAGRADTPFQSTHSKPTTGQPAPGRHSVAVNVTWNADPGKASTMVEVPTWPNMTDADKAAVQKYADAVRAHEDGHHQVTKDALAKAGRTITGEGATPEAAFNDVQHKVKDHYADVDRQVNQANAGYDHTTNHGRTQDAVGGTNVDLRCTGS